MISMVCNSVGYRSLMFGAKEPRRSALAWDFHFSQARNRPRWQGRISETRQGRISEATGEVDGPLQMCLSLSWAPHFCGLACQVTPRQPIRSSRRSAPAASKKKTHAGQVPEWVIMNKLSVPTKSSDALVVRLGCLRGHPGVLHGLLGGRRCVRLVKTRMKVGKVKRGVRR